MVGKRLPRHLGESGQGTIVAMAKAADALLEEALTLPAEERAMLASGLLASLDDEVADEEEVDGWWSAETERRAAQLESGEARTVTWEHVRQRVEERRAHRTA